MEKKPKATFEETKELANMFWLAEDTEYPLECWTDALEDAPDGEVVEVMTAREMRNVFVARRVLTVDDKGEADTTEVVMFETREEAEREWETSLADAQAKIVTGVK